MAQATSGIDGFIGGSVAPPERRGLDSDLLIYAGIAVVVLILLLRK